MMKGMIAPAIALLLSVTPEQVSAKAAESCTVGTKADSTLVRVIYDPFENVQANQPFELAFGISDVEQAGCVLGLAIGGMGSSRERVLRSRGNTIRYEINLDGVVSPNDLNAPVPLRGRVSKGEANLVQPLKLVVPAGQFAPAGAYTDHVALRLYDISGGVPRKLGVDMILAITVDVPARAQINLAGSSSPIFGSVNAGGLDFGELQTGKEREAYIQVRATAPVMLTLQSANSSELRHVSERNRVLGVPYTLTIDGETVDLRRGPRRIDRQPVNGLRADNYRMVAKILDADGRVAGRYEDIVTISVEPK